MADKRKRRQRNYFIVFALEKMKTEQMKGRGKTMLQKRTEYWQEVKKE